MTNPKGVLTSAESSERLEGQSEYTESIQTEQMVPELTNPIETQSETPENIELPEEPSDIE